MRYIAIIAVLACHALASSMAYNDEVASEHAICADAAAGHPYQPEYCDGN